MEQIIKQTKSTDHPTNQSKTAERHRTAITLIQFRIQSRQSKTRKRRKVNHQLPRLSALVEGEGGGPSAAGVGFNVVVCNASGSFNGAAGGISSFSSFSPFRIFSISSLVRVSYSIRALVRSSSSLRFSVRMISARERASSTRRRTSASISCFVSDERRS